MFKNISKNESKKLTYLDQILNQIHQIFNIQ